ncbi:mechanosensitive ion channel family protein [Pseudomonas matsuisoli]|uniref:Mechanosensitive ion channel protein MscS n=1 Tax=Pseudomonas matsuisoli TaxID=1515666 RepID=A0A917Q1E8_9PSED|nr:mechanosensitive ion channel family protein [Pseudomonas matsuisoli]GGK06787.1 mechanosensitive ion channel protein MscS [Pseudomonas matsuisoli]
MDYDWSFWLNRELWVNVGVVLGVTVICYLILRTAIGAIQRRLNAWSEGKHGRFYRLAAVVVANTSRLLLLTFSLMVGLRLVELSPRWEGAMAHAWFIVLALQIAFWLDTGVRLWTSSTVFGEGSIPRNPVTTVIIATMARIMVWSVMLLSILANLGVNITALVASLGVGGIAVALAVQTLLSDIIASLSIGVDKPFETGDFVVFGAVAGTIEHIGLKTTRIRSLSGEQVVCSNTDLLRQTLHNYKRMDTRRIVFKFGITQSTPVDKVREVSTLVRTIIEGIDKVRFDRAHFLAFDDSQLTFEVVYIVLSSDYNAYMDIQQEINLQLLDGLRKLNVHIARPARSLEFIGGRFPEISVAGLPQSDEAANSERAARSQSR